MARPAWIIFALWTPPVVALAFNHQVRRVWQDAWFWAGAVPGRYMSGDSYDMTAFTLVLLASFALWLAVARWRLWVATLCAALQSTVSTLYICALAGS